jgi:hypothetical protein
MPDHLHLLSKEYRMNLTCKALSPYSNKKPGSGFNGTKMIDYGKRITTSMYYEQMRILCELPDTYLKIRSEKGSLVISQTILIPDLSNLRISI